MSPCKEADIAPRDIIKNGISAPDETKSLVYPTSAALNVDLSKDFNSLLCLADDDKKLYIQGTPGETTNFSAITIYFEPCQNQLDEYGRVAPGTTVCKDAVELDEWLERQTIYIFVNQ